MTKGTQTLLLVAAVSALAASAALAAEGPVMKVEIPFGFTAADQQLPAGEYSIVSRPDSSLVRICSKDQKHRVSLFYVPARSDVAAGGELEFHRHGDRRFLKSIRTAGGFAAYIPDSPAERTAGAGGPVAQGLGMR